LNYGSKLIFLKDFVRLTVDVVPFNEGEGEMGCGYPVPELMFFLDITTGKHNSAK
jgi:hypothetical protein